MCYRGGRVQGRQFDGGACRGPEGTLGTPTVAPGDDAGAAELGRRVADNLRERRRVSHLSLDELAKLSGVSRAALSQIETCKTNPSLSVLWTVAVGLKIPFSELIGESRESVSLLRRSEAQVLRSVDGKMESRPLARSGAGPGVEVYELRLAGHGSHESEPHAPGTREPSRWCRAASR